MGMHLTSGTAITRQAPTLIERFLLFEQYGYGPDAMPKRTLIQLCVVLMFTHWSTAIRVVPLSGGISECLFRNVTGYVHLMNDISMMDGLDPVIGC